MARRGLVIAAPGSGAGKTTVTLALLAALSRRGADVAGGKSGPDYIDPAFHRAACGRVSSNFDAWAMDADSLRARAAAVPAELLMIEGAMGVLDGAGRGGTGSAADLAEALGVPVLLVLDAARQGASVGLALAGLRALRPGLPVAGVVLNRLGSARHGEICARAIEAQGVAVLGRLPRMADSLPERHLGLVQAGEHPDLRAFLDRAADWIGADCDLEAVAGATGTLAPAGGAPGRLAPPGQRIAVARDIAFSFTYPHMLDDWRAAGAELLPFSPLGDEAPDDAADAIFLPGGYPELHAGRLAAAGRFRAGMARAAARGARIYGECGGYMVLGRGLEDAEGTRHEMLGLLPLETSFRRRKLSLGYRRLRPRGGAPWQGPLMAHEFHYATTGSPAPDAPLFEAEDADGAALPPMGHCVGSVCGSFAHVIGPGV